MRRVLLSFALLAPSAALAGPPEVEPHIFAAIDAIYRMDFDGAEAGLNRAKEALPAHPYAHFGQAIVTWARYVYGAQQTDPKLKERFEAEVEGAVKVAEAWLKEHPRDAEGYLALSGTYGLRSRLRVIQRSWLGALVDGRRAVKLVRKAWDLDSELYDALLGIGMYDYYADALPRFVKVFSKLFLGGSRERGIERLKLVADRGRYSKVAAQLLLTEIYTEDRWGAKDPAEAVRIIRELRAQYPNSPVFHQIEHVCLYEAGLLDELMASAEEYRQRIEAKAPYYPELDRARMHVTAGTVHFARSRLPEAELQYVAASELAGTHAKPSRWGVWGLIRLGQVRDALEKRALAVEAYKAAAAFPDIWGFREEAQKGAKRPVLFRDGVGQLPPP